MSWYDSIPSAVENAVNTVSSAVKKASLNGEQTRLTEKYNTARARNDPAGMQAANDEMNDLRRANGLPEESASQDIQNMQNTVDGVIAKQTTSSTDGTNDYSSYLKDMYQARQDAALAALESAYNKNMAQIDASEAELPETYQAARNQTAASSAQEKRNFAEYAAANGLNSGASGQAELARNVTLQGNLNSLNQAQADALADLELQRTQANNEYNAAIASAKADGDYQLANALYQEKVRVNEQMYNYALNQQQFNYQKEQNALDRADTDRNTLAAYGQLWLQNGLMPSAEMLGAMELSAADAKAFIAMVKGQ